MKNTALLLLRLTTGGLLMGHGAQKLFGWSGGPGLQGTAGWLESMGLRPGEFWAPMAGLSEFGGGLLTVLGLFNPAGPIGINAAMGVATGKAHWGKPIWATEGGAELPVTNMAVATAIALAGPGRYSLDRALGIEMPRPLSALLTLLAMTGVAWAVSREAPQQVAEQESEEPERASQPRLDVEFAGTRPNGDHVHGSEHRHRAERGHHG